MDVCTATGLDVFPSRMTQAEAYNLASHRLRMAGVKIIIYENPDNAELSGRFLDFPLVNVSETSTVVMIQQALKKLTGDIEVKVGRSIKSDPYFAHRI